MDLLWLSLVKRVKHSCSYLLEQKVNPGVLKTSFFVNGPKSLSEKVRKSSFNITKGEGMKILKL